MFKYLNLFPGEYRIEDVFKIEAKNTLYDLCILVKNVETHSLFIRKLNIQFATKIYLGWHFTPDRYFQSEELFKFEIPSSGILSRKGITDSEYLDEKHLTKDPNNGSIHSKKMFLIKFKKPLLINSRQIKFIVFPNFEMVRFFFFDSGKYNSLLLNSTFDSVKGNKIFNPDETEYSKELKMYRVKIRSKVKDRQSATASELAVVPGFIDHVNNLKSVINSGKNWNTFFKMRLPIHQWTKFSGRGKFCENLDGDQGIIADQIEEVLGYAPKVEYRRDNDGRRTKSYHDGLKKHGTIKKPSKPKRNKKSKKKSEFDNSVPADNEIEELDVSIGADPIDFPQIRKAQVLKSTKTTQDYQFSKGGIHKPKEVKKYGVLSGEGGGGEGTQGINPQDDEFLLSTDEKIRLAYWDNFDDIMESVKSGLSSMTKYEFISSSFKKSGSLVKFNLKKYDPLKYNDMDIYLVRIICDDQKTLYILEYNQNEKSNSLILFTHYDEQNAFSLQELKKIIEEILDKNGSVKELAKLILSTSNPKRGVKYVGLKHLYQKRPKTKGVKEVVYRLYTEKEAIDNLTERIKNTILELIG